MTKYSIYQSGHSDFSKIQYIYRFSKKNIVPIQYIICLKYSTIQYILNIFNILLLQYIKLLKIYVAPQLMHFLIYTSIHLLLCIPILCLYLFLTDYASVYAYVYLSTPLFTCTFNVIRTCICFSKQFGTCFTYYRG